MIALRSSVLDMALSQEGLFAVQEIMYEYYGPIVDSSDDDDELSSSSSSVNSDDDEDDEKESDTEDEEVGDDGEQVKNKRSKKRVMQSSCNDQENTALTNKNTASKIAKMSHRSGGGGITTEGSENTDAEKENSHVDVLSEYELIRMRNIKRNEVYLGNLGF